MRPGGRPKTLGGGTVRSAESPHRADGSAPCLRQERVGRLTIQAGSSGILQLWDVEVARLDDRREALLTVPDQARLKVAPNLPETLVNGVAFAQLVQLDSQCSVIDGAGSPIDPEGLSEPS
ncbi:MAG: hypothetical protein OXN89_17200 [Bryobacterales bacterium]|nr:hypothetical protein [Bryobacterales bacterium]